MLLFDVDIFFPYFYMESPINKCSYCNYILSQEANILQCQTQTMCQCSYHGVELTLVKCTGYFLGFLYP